MTWLALLPVAFAAGLFGSGHCLGMCTPVVVLFEGSTDASSRWRYRLALNAGRGAFYVTLGAVAGGIGLVLTRIAGIDATLRLLRWAAALLVIAIGLNLLFRLPLLTVLESGGARLWQGIAPAARSLLPIRSPGGAAAAGYLWGALPCGLVYSAVALAATTGSIGGGAAVMAAFWAGTLPTLLAAGAAAGRLRSLSARPLLRRIAGVLMIGVGVAALVLPAIMRGMGAGS